MENNKFEAIFLRLVKAYTIKYPEHAFRFCFDDHETKIIGAAQSVIDVKIINTKSTLKRIFTEGSLGLGESYCQGLIVVDDKMYKHFLFIFVRAAYDIKLLLSLNFFDIIAILRARFNRKFFSKGTQHDDINSHYSLSDWFKNEEDANEFYLYWLNSKYIQYSCAKWDSGIKSLEEAQINKFEFYARRLGIDEKSKGKTLLDLGCGWGGLIFYLAERYGVVCRGLTLATAQAAYITKEATARGLNNLVKVEIKNVHDMDGNYDYIVSIGMLEHISHYDHLYQKSSSTLNAGGSALFHAIFHTEMFYKTDPFLLKYIFPGGATPEMRKSLKTLKKYFKSIDKNNLPVNSYPKTLECWHDNFCKNENNIRKLLNERGTVENVAYSIRVFKHYLMLSYCGLYNDASVVSNILVRN